MALGHAAMEAMADQAPPLWGGSLRQKDQTPSGTVSASSPSRVTKAYTKLFG